MTRRRPNEGEDRSGYADFRYGRELAENDPDGLVDDTASASGNHHTGYDHAGYEDDDLGYGDDDHVGYEDDHVGYEDEDGDGRHGPGLVTRRRFLAGLAVGGTVGYTAFWTLGRPDELATIEPTTTTGPPRTTRPVATLPPPSSTTEAVDELASNLLTPAPVDQRVLVLLELEGGNDGPSTVVPYGSGSYYDLRPNLAIPADQVLTLDDEIGLNPNLGRLYDRQLAVVEGVGPVDGSMSHFEMVARWEQGDLSGSTGLRSGFLARLADALDDGSPSIGLSVDGFTPRFNNVTASTLSLNHLHPLRVLTKDDWIHPAYRNAVTSFGGGPMTTTMVESWRHLVEIGNGLPDDMTEIDEESEMVRGGGRFGRQLATAAELIRADLGIRVVHARIDGFDTHKGHEYKQEALMQKVDLVVDGFVQLLVDYGLAERVLVATSSEFGRRAAENGTGLDHGAASTMLLIGPVRPGRHGAPSPFDDLDELGNLKTTVPFDSYLGTLAENWLGVEAGSVLPTSPELLDIV